MIVYRVCSKMEISRIVSDKGFCGVGNYYDVNLKLNTFKYDDPICPVCGSHKIIKKGTIKEQQYQCKKCGKKF